MKIALWFSYGIMILCLLALLAGRFVFDASDRMIRISGIILLADLFAVSFLRVRLGLNKKDKSKED